MRFRVATYNIHRCVGRDGVSDPQRIADVLRAVDADLVALQEVAYAPDHPDDILQYLAAAAGARAIAGPTLLEAKGRYGNALLSRRTPDAVQRADISVPGREPRGVIQLVLTRGGTTVAALATHLGLGIEERRRQMNRILAMLRLVKADVVILMGDFNEWLPWARPLRRAALHFDAPVIPAPATFPSRRPLLALDRIWVRAPRPLTDLRVFAEAPARQASDHLPLVADIEL
jgi:endonuclease/exonuclease/phosphatase family metal-dependent hydrolase